MTPRPAKGPAYRDWPTKAIAQLACITPATAASLSLWLDRRRERAANYKRRDRSMALAAVAVVFALGLAATVGVLASKLSPREHGALAAVFPPWVDDEEVAARVYRAGGLTIGQRHGGWLVYAAGASDRFEDALRDEGAWLLLDGAQAASLFGRP